MTLVDVSKEPTLLCLFQVGPHIFLGGVVLLVSLQNPPKKGTLNNRHTTSLGFGLFHPASSFLLRQKLVAHRLPTLRVPIQPQHQPNK